MAVNIAHASAKAEREGSLSMIVSIIASLLLGFGVTLLAISAAYIRDLETLRRVPEAVWLFICGTPSQDPTTLPLMLTLSIVSLVLSVVLVVANQRIAAKMQQHS